MAPRARASELRDLASDLPAGIVQHRETVPFIEYCERGFELTGVSYVAVHKLDRHDIAQQDTRPCNGR